MHNVLYARKTNYQYSIFLVGWEGIFCWAESAYLYSFVFFLLDFFHSLREIYKKKRLSRSCLPEQPGATQHFTIVASFLREIAQPCTSTARP